MKDIRLTPTSYIVLGLLNEADDVTPYDLKAMVAVGVGNLWSLQHTQLYAEPERLAAAGYLTETREEGGRRRKQGLGHERQGSTAADRNRGCGWTRCRLPRRPFHRHVLRTVTGVRVSERTSSAAPGQSATIVTAGGWSG